MGEQSDVQRKQDFGLGKEWVAVGRAVVCGRGTVSLGFLPLSLPMVTASQPPGHTIVPPLLAWSWAWMSDLLCSCKMWWDHVFPSNQIPTKIKTKQIKSLSEDSPEGSVVSAWEPGRPHLLFRFCHVYCRRPHPGAGHSLSIQVNSHNLQVWYAVVLRKEKTEKGRTGRASESI